MIRVFVEGTQNGFAVGTKKDGKIIKETYFHDSGTNESIDRAYKQACEFASSLKETMKRKPQLLKRQGWIR